MGNESSVEQDESQCLHLATCRQRGEDIRKMRLKLQENPRILDHLQTPSTPASLLTRMMLNHDVILPLNDAIGCGHFRCVKFIIDSGANVNQPDASGKTSIDYVMNLSDVCNPYKEIKVTDPKTALTHYKIINYLIEKGVVLNRAYDLGCETWYLPTYALKEALERKENKSVKLLLESGTDTEEYTFVGSKKIYCPKAALNYLEYSLSEGNPEGYRLMLLHGARNRVFCMKANMDTSRPFIEYALPYHIINYAGRHGLKYALEALKIFRDFGGNLWMKDVWGGAYWETPTEKHKKETALDYLRRTPKLMARLPGLDIKLAQMMKTPLSLKKWSRIAIRNCMGRNYWKTSQELKVNPEELKEFLLFGVKEDYPL